MTCAKASRTSTVKRAGISMLFPGNLDDDPASRPNRQPGDPPHHRAHRGGGGEGLPAIPLEAPRLVLSDAVSPTATVRL